MKRTPEYNREESLNKKAKHSGSKEVIMVPLPEAVALPSEIHAKVQSWTEAKILCIEPLARFSDSFVLGQICSDTYISGQRAEVDPWSD